MDSRHISAFRGEITKHFGLSLDQVFYDLTLGDGTHTGEALSAGCRVVSFDIDPNAITRAVRYVGLKHTPIILDPQTDTKPQPNFGWIIINDNFAHLQAVVAQYHLPLADAILIDLGPSQFQTLTPGYGMSFQTDEPLDMRLDQNSPVKASDLLLVLNQGELERLFDLADEPFAKPIARAIAKERQTAPITTTSQLVRLISGIKRHQRSKIHPATQVFMALRMAVNLERENIREVLPQAMQILKPGGLLGVISFHSGEDRLIKEFVKSEQDRGTSSAINDKPITPSSTELAGSDRTRSAKLRIIKKNE
jgi:16S rRNA (cytosine1402-N4)-methyltransferase